MDTGWIKLHRKLRDNPYMRRPAYRAVWIELLLEAQHGMKKVGNKWVKKDESEMKSILWNGKKIRLKAGQLTVGMRQLGEWTGVPRGTCERIVKCFKNEEMIEEQTSPDFSLISINKWEQYQNSEEPVEEQMRNKRGTDEEQMRTPREWDNGENGRMKEPEPTASGDAEIVQKSKTKTTPPKPSKEKKDPNEPVSLTLFLEEMRKSKRRDMQIIADWAEVANPPCVTRGQWSSFITRHLRAAKSLEPFTEHQINVGFTKMREADYITKPTLETILKFIT